MSKKNFYRVTASVLIGSMVITGAAWAEEPAAEVTEAPALRVVGEAGEDALQVELTNKTGNAITYLSIIPYDGTYDPNADVVALQEKLIEEGYLEGEADGSYGPMTSAAVAAFREANGLPADGGADEEMITALFGYYDDGNVLEKDDVIEAEESVLLSYIPEAAEDDAEADDAEEEDALTEYLVQYEITPEYVAVVRLDNDQEYTLFVFLLNEIESAELYVSGDIAYVQYKAEGTEDVVSTQDAEQAIYDYQHPAPTYSYDDYYYEPAYDYSYDYGYYDQAQGADGCVEDGLFY